MYIINKLLSANRKKYNKNIFIISIVNEVMRWEDLSEN